MYALSHLRRQPFEKFKYPPNDWAYPLMTKDWIRIKETNMKKPSDF